MRVTILFLVLLIGVVGFPSPGQAEKVRTNQNAKVYNRPGEQGKVVAKVKEGQAMTVLAKEGRWLKVRVAGRTGYVPRSKVDLPSEDDEIPRNTRRRAFVDGRSKKRGFGGEDTAPEDRIGADAIGDNGAEDAGDEPDGDEPVRAKRGGGDDDEPADDDDEPAEDEDEEEIEDDRVRARVSSKTVAYSDDDDESDEAFEAKPSDILFVERTRGDWTEVSIEDGDIGWILTSELDMEEDDEGGAGGKRSRAIVVGARLGVTFVSQAVSSIGGTQAWPDKYRVGSSAATIAVGGGVLYPYKKDFLVGGELAYDLARAIPGVPFDPDKASGPMPSSTTGFTLHNLNLRLVGGYDLKKKSGATVFARLGYHYESFLVANVRELDKNNARLPSEIISGPMIGAAFAMPTLTDKIGLRVSLDAMVIGSSVKQTVNLENGADPSARRVTLGAGFNYRWRPGLDIQATYDLNYGSLSFGAPVANSMRGQTGTSAARSDLHHTVAVGVGKAF